VIIIKHHPYHPTNHLLLVIVFITRPWVIMIIIIVVIIAPPISSAYHRLLILNFCRPLIPMKITKISVYQVDLPLHEGKNPSRVNSEQVVMGIVALHR